MLSLLLALWALPAPTAEPVRFVTADVSLVRSFVSWPDRHGRIESERPCEGRVQIPVYDFRAAPHLRPGARSAELRCETKYRELAVPVVVSGRVEYVPAKEFGLALPEGTDVVRVYFLLHLDVGSAFPYLNY